MASEKYKGITDSSGNANIQRASPAVECALILGLTNYGMDFKAWGETTGSYMQWDQSVNTLKLTKCNTAVKIDATSNRGIWIGEEANTVGSGIPLDYTNWGDDTIPNAQGNAIYCDDGGKIWAAGGYIEAWTIRLLSTSAVTGDKDVSMTPLHTDLTLNAAYDGVGGLSSIWGNTTIMASKSIDTSGGLGDVGGATFGLDIKGTLASNSFGCGVSVGGSISGTKSGILTGFRVRNIVGAGNWDGFLSVPNGNGVTQDAAAGSTTDKFLKVYVGTTLYTIDLKRA